MKNMKKLVSLLLAVCLMASLAIGASAANTVDASGGTGTSSVNLSSTSDGTLNGAPAATKMSVVIPTILPIAVGTDGTVTTATDIRITNNSFGAVKVDNVKVEAGTGWKLSAFGSKDSLAKVKVDSNMIGFKLALGGGAEQLTNAENAASQTLIDAAIDGCYMSGNGDQSANSIAVSYRHTESHSFNSRGICSKCGYEEDTSCSHTNTKTVWDGCDWEEICRDCGETVDWGTTHGSYSYGDWQYYSTSQHRRYGTCDDCGGGGKYQYGSHSTSTEYYEYDSTKHTVEKYCSTCDSEVSSTTQNHSLKYGSWENDSDTQHRRSATCSFCGYSGYTYANHSFKYGSWANYSDSQHRRTKSCSTCSTSDYEYADHTYTYGKWSSATTACHSSYYSEERIYDGIITMINKLRFCEEDILGQTIQKLEFAAAAYKRNNRAARQLSQSIAELNAKLLALERLRSKGYLAADIYHTQARELRQQLSKLKTERYNSFESRITTMLEDVWKLKSLIDELEQPLEVFDEKLFHDIVTDICINNRDEMTVTLLGGLKFTEQI